MNLLLRPPSCTLFSFFADERKRQMEEKDRLRKIAREQQQKELLVLFVGYYFSNTKQSFVCADFT